MQDFVQFVLAMWDAFIAALVGLNPVPVVIFALFTGMVQPRRLYWLSALLCVIPSVIVIALWPMLVGYTPIWPDLTQLEVEIQLIAMWIIAYAAIRLMAAIKTTIATVLPSKADDRVV